LSTTCTPQAHSRFFFLGRPRHTHVFFFLGRPRPTHGQGVRRLPAAIYFGERAYLVRLNTRAVSGADAAATREGMGRHVRGPALGTQPMMCCHTVECVLLVLCHVRGPALGTQPISHVVNPAYAPKPCIPCISACSLSRDTRQRIPPQDPVPILLPDA